MIFRTLIAGRRPEPARHIGSVLTSMALAAATIGVLGPMATASADTTPSDPDESPTTADATSSGLQSTVLEALVTSTVEVPTNLGFLRGDGDRLWATGAGGLVVRIDPDSGTVDELTVDGIAPDGRLLPTVLGDSVWLSELGGTRVFEVDRGSFEVGPPIDLGHAAGMLASGDDGIIWDEVSEQPAGLVPFDASTGVVGDFVLLDDDGEVVGSTSAFGSLWAPLYDDNEIVRLDADGSVIDTFETGVGPATLTAVGDNIWFVNRIEGTVGRLDPETSDLITVDLNIGGPAVESPTGLVGSDTDLWLTAAVIGDDTAIVFRLDAATGDIVSRRLAPGTLRVETIGGLASIDGRLFLLDRTAGTVLELDVDDFTEVPDPDRPAPTTEVVTLDDADVTAAVQSIFSSDTDPDDMATLIEDGHELSEPIAAFRQFFADQFPGEAVGAEVYGVRVTGDEAEVDYAVTVSGAPIIEIRTAHLDRVDGDWLLRRADFCDLVALGAIDCPS